jgi:Clp amino terminal domain, pathogenicity island component
MFERFTDRARRVVVLAQEEAGRLNHNYIGTEHLLLGLIHEGEGIAARALEALGIRLEVVREEVEEIIGRGSEPPAGRIPFTPRAKKVLELSLREALQLSHSYIGTEHILLGLIREGEGVAAQVLVTLGADLARVRGQVITLLSGEAVAAGEPPAQERVILQDMPPAVAGGPAFRAQQPAELVRVVPLVRELARRGGYRVVLISLEVWSGWVHLRYALLPAEPAEAPPLVDLPIRWRLGDDLDTAYQLVGGGSAGDPLLRIYHLSFQPAPPSEANTLTITVQDQDGADLAAVEVPLAGAS